MNARNWGVSKDRISFWFNTKTGEVEEGPKSLGRDRIGPFETREDAARGPEIVAERARKLREEDEEEED